MQTHLDRPRFRAFRAVRALRTVLPTILILTFCTVGPDPVRAASHREAPLITSQPKVDGTDFYMFRSYEPGREDFVTLVANYLPLQDPYAGPNYFAMDPNALYEIHIDNNGDAQEDITFQFRIQTEKNNLTLDIGEPGETVSVPVPLVNTGPIGGSGDDPDNPEFLNRNERYKVDVIFGDRRTGTRQAVVNADTAEEIFTKPVDNIGTNTIANYPDYAANFVYTIELPDSSFGRLFMGQRKDPFVVNLGEIFDLFNMNPTGPENGEQDDLADKNVTAFTLEVPIDFLLGDGGNPVVGGWTTASLRRHSGPDDPAAEPGGLDAPVPAGGYTQVSRLGIPLVNEAFIGYCDKDVFNASEPRNDSQFLQYVTHPTLPALLEILFGVQQPQLFPRDDLVGTFLTGTDGLNQPESVVPAEMLRLNTEIAPTPRCDQSRLGVIGGDLAGFPNGRRPGDDVVDIALRVAMGVLLPPSVAPDGDLPYTDGAFVDASFFGNAFPYLRTPLPGSPSHFDPEPEEPCPPGTDGVTRIVLRNLGPDIIVFLFTSTTQVINGGVPATLPPGGEFTAEFDTVLEDVNLFIDEVDQGLSIDVPLDRKLIVEWDGATLLSCVTSLGGECP